MATFGVNLRPFYSSENCSYLGIIDHWTIIVFLVVCSKHSSPRSLSKLQQKYIRTMKTGNICFFVFGINLRYFHLAKSRTFFSKAYLTTYSLLGDPFQRSNRRCLSNIGKKWIKTLKFGNFWDFRRFRCQFQTFHSKYFYLFTKDYSTTHSVHVDPLKQPNLRSLSKLYKKCFKTLKFGKFWDFCNFWCQCQTFSFRTLQLSPN